MLVEELTPPRDLRRRDAEAILCVSIFAAALALANLLIVLYSIVALAARLDRILAKEESVATDIHG